MTALIVLLSIWMVATTGTTTSTRPTITASPSLWEPILSHPVTTSEELQSRTRLKPRHEHLFTGDCNTSLFNQLGNVTCKTGVICRKEFLETYAAATLIHQHYISSSTKRIADLAAGHGLLGWFLLAMDEEEEEKILHQSSHNDSAQPHHRTVVCIDRRKPKSAQIIHNTMLHHFPSLEHRFTYISADLNWIEPHPSCLLASVHACGLLTDVILDKSIRHNVPVALVPCCQSVREGFIKPHSEFSPLNLEELSSRVELEKAHKSKVGGINIKHDAVANVVDQNRIQTLQRAGFQVTEAFLPEQITGRNRVIMAEPMSTSGPSVTRTSTTGGMPPLRIPLRDDAVCIRECQRLSQTTPRTAKPEQVPSKGMSLTLHLSIREHDDDDGNGDALEIARNHLQSLIDESCSNLCDDTLDLECHVSPTQQQQQDGWNMFQLVYRRRPSNQKLKGPARAAAKTLHAQLRTTIETEGKLKIR